MEPEYSNKTITILSTAENFRAGLCGTCRKIFNTEYINKSDIYHCGSCGNQMLCEECFNRWHASHRNLTEIWKIIKK